MSTTTMNSSLGHMADVSEEDVQRLLSNVPSDGTTIGNTTLAKVLEWAKDLLERAR